MKEIYVGFGLSAKVDDSDYENLKHYMWKLKKSETKGGAKYAFRYDFITKRLIYMQRDILGEMEGMQIDHIDGNGLNNQRSNLRFCTPRENILNRSNNYRHKFRGITETPDKRFAVRVKNEGKYIQIGIYDTLKEAINAHNEAIVRLHGEFANLAPYTLDEVINKYEHVIKDNYKQIAYYVDCIKSLHEEIMLLYSLAQEQNQ